MPFPLKTMSALATLCVAGFSIYAHGMSVPGKDVALEDRTQNAPVLVELFTSQGCSSCPPAEALFADLAEQPGVVSIEWHVDYWDSLVHRGTRWKDPFSSADYTERQRRYNQALRGTSGNYTPQAVIAGRFEAIGSSRAQITRHINAAPAGSVTVKAAASGSGYAVSVDSDAPTMTESDVVFVRLLEKQTTKVSGGENAGRKLSGAHLVLESVTLGRFSGGSETFTAPALKEGETCAIIVQERGRQLGPIHGAAYCPA